MLGALVVSQMLLSADVSRAAQYELQIGRNPTLGYMRLLLEAPLPSDTQFFARSLGAENEILDPRCEDTGEELARVGETWIASAGCSTITWQVPFHTASAPSIDLSKQSRLYYPGGWWLFTEWGALLRQTGDQTPSEICAKSDESMVCQPVPPVEHAPLFLLLGAPEETLAIKGTNFRMFSGHLPDTFDLGSLYETYKSQLSYISSLSAGTADDEPPPQTIDVLLLGIDALHGTAGGAIGSSTFLANVAVQNGAISASEQSRLLWISGHELSHLLGLSANALWATESLAHYYGYKSLGKGHAEAGALFDKMAADIGNIGLLEANARVTEHGEGQYYHLFYSRGAVFWKAIDDLIFQATSGRQSLDDFLPLLLRGDFGPHGALPQEFIESVASAVGHKDLERITGQHL